MILLSERAPHKKQDRNCQTVTNIWSWAPNGAWHQDWLTDWSSVALWLWLWLETGRSNRSIEHESWLFESRLRNWQSQNNCKKGIRLWQEDFICDMKCDSEKETRTILPRPHSDDKSSYKATSHVKATSPHWPVRPGTQQETGLAAIMQMRHSMTTGWQDACPWKLCKTGMLTDVKTEDKFTPSGIVCDKPHRYKCRCTCNWEDPAVRSSEQKE
jgi:hypothetical protein